jgi:flagellar hook assembly protein FlgD
MTAASANNSNSTDNSYVVATPLAPAIKGLDRSAVAVELKSAGDVKISIVNVNGAQVVSVVEKNLQLGVHQIKWNTEKLSNGRYVVKIEQNGLVNAKNIILK